MPKAAELVCDVLIEAGVDHVFGIPGGGTLPVWDALVDRKDKIRCVLARHEGGAACMADAYGRLAGKPAVLMGQGLWIGTSGGYGIVESYLAGVPMVVLCDASDYMGLSQFGPYQNATGEYGAVDLVSMMRSMTKYTTFAADGSELVHGARLAVQHATTGRPGPACVLFRFTAPDTPMKLEEIRPKLYATEGHLRVSPPSISIPDAERIAALLGGAKAPLLIAGAGVHRSRAYAEVQELAELLGMPVATTYMGKSSIPETHDLSVGTIGVIGQKIANQKIREADVILAVGTCLAPDNTKMLSPKFIEAQRQKIIQIDVEPRNMGWTYPIEIGVTSDARLALREILRILKAQKLDPDAKRRVIELRLAKAEAKFFADDALRSDQVPIAPERLVREVTDAVGEDDLVVLDAGNNRLWMAHYFQSKKAGQVVAPGGAAGVGYSLAASLAAQMARPKSRVVCVCGDGGMMMHLYVLEMAKEYGLPVTYVVMNNACLGNVMDFQPEGRRIASKYPAPDFARIAQGFGVEGVRVEEPGALAAALRRALGTEAPVVVDVRIDDYPHFRMRG